MNYDKAAAEELRKIADALEAIRNHLEGPEKAEQRRITTVNTEAKFRLRATP